MDLAFGSIGTTVLVAATTISQSTSLPGTSNQIRVYNASGSIAFWRAGQGPQTVDATDTFIGPGATEVFSIPLSATHMGIILATGTGNVYAQRGGGI